MRRMTKNRRDFGNITRRANRNGVVTSLVARYPDPNNPRHRIQKSFRPSEEDQAIMWLRTEEKYLDQCLSTHTPWLSPKQREQMLDDSRVLFGDYVEEWIANYRTKAGARLSGSSMRNIRADVSHFLDDFKDMAVQQITPQDIRKWYEKPHPEGPHAFHRACQRFKAVMRCASTERLDGSPALRPDNPFIFPIPPLPDSGRDKVPPITPEELRALYENMPGYTRLSVYLSALAGGLRIGEVCALRVGDIDFRNKTLHVRHSVSRGENDRGATRLSSTKTASSTRNVIIPDGLIPLIREHIAKYCDPGRDAMLFKPRKVTVLSQNTLRKHFDVAKKAAGRPDIVFHTLRASHATLLILAGGTLREAMNQLGHTSTDVAIRHYQRAVDEHTARVANALADRMLPAVRTPEVVEAEIAATEEQLERVKRRLESLRRELRELR